MLDNTFVLRGINIRNLHLLKKFIISPEVSTNFKWHSIFRLLFSQLLYLLYIFHCLSESKDFALEFYTRASSVKEVH